MCKGTRDSKESLNFRGVIFLVKIFCGGFLYLVRLKTGSFILWPRSHDCFYFRLICCHFSGNDCDNRAQCSKNPNFTFCLAIL